MVNRLDYGAQHQKVKSPFASDPSSYLLKTTSFYGAAKPQVLIIGMDAFHVIIIVMKYYDFQILGYNPAILKCFYEN